MKLVAAALVASFHVKALPYVDGSRVSLYGVSLGGNLVAYLISKVPTIHAAVLGAPAATTTSCSARRGRSGRTSRGARSSSRGPSTPSTFRCRS